MSSMKSVSFLSDINFLVNINSIFNLSAPGAAKLVKPLALSYKLSSSFALIINSFICKPTLYDELLL